MVPLQLACGMTGQRSVGEAALGRVMSGLLFARDWQATRPPLPPLAKGGRVLCANCAAAEKTGRGTGSPRAEGAVEVEGGADQGQVGERLREVAPGPRRWRRGFTGSGN